MPSTLQPFINSK